MAMVLSSITSRNGRVISAQVETQRDNEDIRLVPDKRSPEQIATAIDHYRRMYTLLEPENISPFGNGEPEQFVSQFEEINNEVSDQ